LPGGEPVQLDDKKGFVFRRRPEAEALERWTKREFLEVERNIAREWRRSLTRVDFDAIDARRAESVCTPHSRGHHFHHIVPECAFNYSQNFSWLTLG
jgi:hypothetical protein